MQTVLATIFLPVISLSLLYYFTKRGKMSAALHVRGFDGEDILNKVIAEFRQANIYTTDVVDDLVRKPWPVDLVVYGKILVAPQEYFLKQFADFQNMNETERFFELKEKLSTIYNVLAAKRTDIPTVHERYALLNHQNGNGDEARKAILKAVDQRKSIFEKAPYSGNAYSRGLSNYNAALMHQQREHVSDPRNMEFIMNSLLYLSLAEDIVLETKDQDKCDIREWWMGGYYFLSAYWIGELAMLHAFDLVPAQLGLECRDFNPNYCAIERFSMCAYINKRFLKEAILDKELSSANQELSKQLSWMRNVAQRYYEDATALLAELQSKVGPKLDDRLLNLNGEYLIELTNKLKANRKSV